MKTQISQQKTAATKNSARYTASFPIALPAASVDLYQWLADMTDADYQSYSGSHLAMGSFVSDGVLHTVNVENIGNETLVQNYEMRYQSPGHVQMYSPRTKAYVMRWFPAEVGVPWELQVRATSENTCELVCLIGADFPSRFLKVAAWINGLGGYFLRRHLRQEGKAFARHIERKFSR